MILPATPESYARARDVLARGGLVALPTETVYGLAGDARNAQAVASIYALKGRPTTNPLITHITDPGQADDYGHLPADAHTLAGRFWPGPLTLVVERRASDLAGGADAGFPTIAIRCPDAPWRTHISGPLVMPSANRSGHVSPTTAAHVAGEFGEDLLILDNGPCRGGLESTVVRVEDGGATILRPGGVTSEQIAALVPLIEAPKEGSPGLLAKHYAPLHAVRLNATGRRAHEYLIGFGDMACDDNLSPAGDLAEAARNLYAALRRADARLPVVDGQPLDVIAVAPIPEEGLGVALNDRLARAARGR